VWAFILWMVAHEKAHSEKQAFKIHSGGFWQAFYNDGGSRQDFLLHNEERQAHSQLPDPEQGG